MARTVKEWIAKNDDTSIPPRVRLRVFDRHMAVCRICKLKIKPIERWQADHVVALINGGEHRETNLAPVHSHCHVGKTARDAAEKSKVAAVRKKHLGIVDPPKLRGAPFQKSRKAARREQVAASKIGTPGPKPLYAPKEANR